MPKLRKKTWEIGFPLSHVPKILVIFRFPRVLFHCHVRRSCRKSPQDRRPRRNSSQPHSQYILLRSFLLYICICPPRRRSVPAQQQLQNPPSSKTPSVHCLNFTYEQIRSTHTLPQSVVCPAHQVYHKQADCHNHSQSGNKTSAQSALCNQRTDLIH